MLTEKRYELILELLDKKRSVTVPEIKEVLGVSESTIRCQRAGDFYVF